MWLSHLYLFGGKSAAAWTGLVVVVENITSSTVHSYLFNFSNGWLYPFAVGVFGGCCVARIPRNLPAISRPMGSLRFISDNFSRVWALGYFSSN
jgi:hypothetical protein